MSVDDIPEACSTTSISYDEPSIRLRGGLGDVSGRRIERATKGRCRDRRYSGHRRGHRRQLPSRWYAVVGTSRSISPSTASDYVTVRGDVADVEAALMVGEQAISRFGRVDTLINNAGTFISKPFTDYTFDDYLEITAVNRPGSSTSRSASSRSASSSRYSSRYPPRRLYSHGTATRVLISTPEVGATGSVGSCERFPLPFNEVSRSIAKNARQPR